MYLIKAENATEAMFWVFHKISREGEFVGKTSDILDVHVVIEKPTQALTHMRKQHWVWALQEGSDRLNPEFENPGEAYRFRPNWQKKLAREEGAFCYTYGEVYRAQLPIILKKLKAKQTREAIINMWDSRFLFEDNDRTPCTLTLHFLVRGGRLHLFVSMRTNDAMNLMPYDLWHHCLLQRYVASKLGLELGEYHHQADHAYVPKRRVTTGNLKRTVDELAETADKISRDPVPFYSDADFLASSIDADMTYHYRALQDMRNGNFSQAIQSYDQITSPFVKDWTGTLITAEGNARGYKPSVPVLLPDINFIHTLGYHLRSR